MSYDKFDIVGEDCFKKTFKYYKSNKPKPSFEKLLSVENCDKSDKVAHVTLKGVDKDSRLHALGLIRQTQWKSFTFHGHPGLIFIRNPFTNAGQRFWIQRCLEEYPKKPNRTNLDAEMYLEDWWKQCFVNPECDRILQKKLRWSTLGYHHNWDTKVYTEQNCSPFPVELAELSDVVAQYIGYTSFKAQAAIINYYHMDSTLSPHTDHSEINLEAPLLSFSFGQSAIFLIGGKDKSVEPSAILLKSGDIVVMSKEARLCYHAVPRILLDPSSAWNDPNDVPMAFNNSQKVRFKYLKSDGILLNNQDNADWGAFRNYTAQSRINMNVRQVLKENQISLQNYICS